jgi:8-oxo-dGTP diphosphatase
LHDYNFPVANKPIITALRLPDEMMITGNWQGSDEFFQRLDKALAKGIRLVQLRAHHCSPQEYVELFRQAKHLCDEYKALLMVNTSLDIFYQLPAAAGIHLTAERLSVLSERPVDKKILLGASCHNKEEMEQAHRIGVDYILLGPVYQTATHPEAIPLGIEKFSRLAVSTVLPVFGLGGLQLTDKDKLLDAGAYGIAGISLYG